MGQPFSDPREFFLERLDALPLEGYYSQLPDLEGELDDEAEYWGKLGANYEEIG